MKKMDDVWHVVYDSNYSGATLIRNDKENEYITFKGDLLSESLNCFQYFLILYHLK